MTESDWDDRWDYLLSPPIRSTSLRDSALTSVVSSKRSSAFIRSKSHNRRPTSFLLLHPPPLPHSSLVRATRRPSPTLPSPSPLMPRSSLVKAPRRPTSTLLSPPPLMPPTRLVRSSRFQKKHSPVKRRCIKNSPRYVNLRQDAHRHVLLKRQVLAVLSVLSMFVSASVLALMSYKYAPDFRTSSPAMCDNDTSSHRQEFHYNYTSPLERKKEIDKASCRTKDNTTLAHVYFNSLKLSIDCRSENKTLEIDSHLNIPLDGIIIRDSGQYYIYSSVHFKFTQKPRYPYTPWKHYIFKKGELTNYDILATASYTCSYDCLDTNRTSYIAGVFQLNLNDIIKTSVCGHMDVFNERFSTYMGLLKISNNTLPEC